MSPALKNQRLSGVFDVITAIRTYVRSTIGLRRLVRPVTANFRFAVPPDMADDVSVSVTVFDVSS